MNTQSLLTFERFESPRPLFAYVERFVLPFIDGFVIDEDVKRMITHQAFCYEVLKKIEDFYIDDWDLVGALLDEENYEVAGVILDRKSSVQKCHYRIAISINKPNHLFQVGSYNRGGLFRKVDVNKYEYATLERKYARKLRYDNKAFHPSSVIDFVRQTDELNEVTYRIQQRNVFFKPLGPKSLFAYAERLALRHRENIDAISNNVLTAFKLKYPDEYHQTKLEYIASSWQLESIALNEQGEIVWLLMFHNGDFDRHMLLDGHLKPLEIFHEKITYWLPSDDARALMQERIASIYLERLKELVRIPVHAEERPSTAGAVFQDHKVLPSDAYDGFRHYFEGKRIVVIGPSFVSAQEMDSLAYELGLPHGTIDCHNIDFDKLRGTNFDYLKESRDRYLGIILGPTPHKVSHLGMFASLSSKLTQENGFPYTIEASSNTLGKNLKITKSSFMASLFQIMRFHLKNMT